MDEKPLTKTEKDALASALHLHRVLDGCYLNSGRLSRLRTLRRLEARGLMTEEWSAAVDGDGFTIEPERYKRCFGLTEEGMKAAVAFDDEMRASWPKPREIASP